MQIIEAKNKTLEGLKGKIVDETKNTFAIETTKGLKKILKKEVTLLFKTKSGSVKIEGEVLVGRPEERIKQKKKLVKRW